VTSHMTTKTAQIRSRLSDYLSGSMSLPDYTIHFAQETWGFDRWSDDQQARNLAAHIELLLAEYTQGTWGEDDLYSELAPLMFADPARWTGGDVERVGLTAFFSQQNTLVVQEQTVPVAIAAGV